MKISIYWGDALKQKYRYVTSMHRNENIDILRQSIETMNIDKLHRCVETKNINRYQYIDGPMGSASKQKYRYTAAMHRNENIDILPNSIEKKNIDILRQCIEMKISILCDSPSKFRYGRVRLLQDDLPWTERRPN